MYVSVLLWKSAGRVTLLHVVLFDATRGSLFIPLLGVYHLGIFFIEAYFDILKKKKNLPIFFKFLSRQWDTARFWNNMNFVHC